MQCTPDLLPADITGFNMFDQKSREFEFRRGPVFADVLLADEINRTTPRTQSALFEAMAERQVAEIEGPAQVVARGVRARGVEQLAVQQHIVGLRQGHRASIAHVRPAGTSALR